MAQRLLRKDGRFFKLNGRLVDAAHGDCCCGSTPTTCCGPQPYSAGTCGGSGSLVLAERPTILSAGTLNGFERKTGGANAGTTTYTGAPFVIDSDPPLPLVPCDDMGVFALRTTGTVIGNPGTPSELTNQYVADFRHGGSGSVTPLRYNTQWMRAGPFSAPVGNSYVVVQTTILTRRGALAVLGGADLRTGQAANAGLMFNSGSLAQLRANDPLATIDAALTGGYSLAMNGCNPTLSMGFRWTYSYNSPGDGFYEGDLTLAANVQVVNMCSFAGRPGGCANCPDDGAEVVPV